jgi:hypothetical protein
MSLLIRSEPRALFGGARKNTEQLYRSLGLSAHLGWARLLVGR